MENKFVSLLKTLEKNELRAFKKYFKTLYHGQKAAIALLEYLEPMHPKFENKTKLERIYIQKRLTKKLGNTASPNVANTFSDLYLYLKKYLLIQAFEQSSYEQDIAWIKILNERKLYEKASRATEKLRKKLKNDQVIDASIYLKKMQAYDLEFHNMYNHKFNIGADNLEYCLQYLDLFYASTHLKYTSELSNRRKVFKVDKVINSSYAFDIALREENRAEQLLIIYSKIKDLLSGSQAAYDEIEERLFKYKDEISLEDQNAIITYLTNFILQNNDYNEKKYLEKLARNYSLGFDTGALLISTLTVDKFINIVGIGCKLGKFSWANNVIEEYGIYLDDEVKFSTISYAKALIAFEQNNTKDIYNLLQGVNFVHANNEFRARSILLRTYVNQKEDEGLILAYCRSYKRFLSNGKLSNTITIPINNFITLIEQLYKRTSTKEEFINKINKTSPLFFKDWLLDIVTNEKW